MRSLIVTVILALADPATAAEQAPRPPQAPLEQRVTAVENDVAELKKELTALKAKCYGVPQAMAAKAGCPCGDACPCGPGQCPAGCPAPALPAAMLFNGVHHTRRADGVYCPTAGFGPATCAGGSCAALPPAQVAGQMFQGDGGSCSGGSCSGGSCSPAPARGGFFRRR